MDKEYTPAEILEENEKGKKYAHLLEGFDKYPMITDNEGKILSMPPIINGNLTRLEEDTHTIIVDITGTDKKAVEQSLNIICCSFAEVGGKIKSMEMVYEDKTITTPDLTPREKTVHVDYTNQLIGGTNLNAEDIIALKEAIARDVDAINFVENFAKQNEGSQKALKKLTAGGASV